MAAECEAEVVTEMKLEEEEKARGDEKLDKRRVDRGKHPAMNISERQ